MYGYSVSKRWSSPSHADVITRFAHSLCMLSILHIAAYFRYVFAHEIAPHFGCDVAIGQRVFSRDIEVANGHFAITITK